MTVTVNVTVTVTTTTGQDGVGHIPTQKQQTRIDNEMLDKFERDEGIRHFQRGVALERVNRILEAVEEYRQAIARYPYLREAHAALGFYYQRNGLLAKAAEEFRTVATLEGDFLSYFNLGHVLVELARYDEALAAFEYCLSIDAGDPATHYEIAYINYVCHNYQTALDHLHIPLRCYPEDWEVCNLIGKCHLGLAHYDQALLAFERALVLANIPQIELELLDNIAMVERYCEFRTLSCLKDRMYAEEGVVHLGSARDNGLLVDAVQDYHFTYPDIATTVQRFLSLQQAQNWQFTAVLATDRLAEPLAQAFGHLLQLPVRRFEEIDEYDTTLLVMAVAREVELLLTTLERLPCPQITFCLGLNWVRRSKVYPDVTGVVAQDACSVPWDAELRRLCACGSHGSQVSACIQDAAAQVVQAVDATPPDKNLTRQIRYYTRKHPRLSFGFHTE